MSKNIIRSAESDELLAISAAKGSQEAFSQLLERYTGLIFYKISRAGSCGVEAEDLFQESSIALLYAARSYREGEASFKTFAGVCIDNRIKTAIRSGRTRQQFFELSSCKEWLQEAEQADESADPEEQVLISEGVTELKLKITGILSDSEYSIFNHYLSGRPYEDIAKIMGTDKKSVDNALQRAKRKLRRALLK